MCRVHQLTSSMLSGVHVKQGTKKKSVTKSRLCWLTSPQVQAIVYLIDIQFKDGQNSDMWAVGQPSRGERIKMTGNGLYTGEAYGSSFVVCEGN